MSWAGGRPTQHSFLFFFLIHEFTLNAALPFTFGCSCFLFSILRLSLAVDLLSITGDVSLLCCEHSMSSLLFLFFFLFPVTGVLRTAFFFYYGGRGFSFAYSFVPTCVYRSIVGCLLARNPSREEKKKKKEKEKEKAMNENFSVNRRCSKTTSSSSFLFRR